MQQALNLARKWRPQSFDQVIGQDIPIRMVKNSLYLKKYFPVYLFAGQRGCGKTTTARIFAAAVNCQSLISFQQTPTTPLPCLTCNSCQAMARGDHPDFIEIDAASHTGVDNVRQIIESSSYMPLLGQKKVYLIDEAHMLSKAAFNAFLKILEEPPLSVIFILATTEVPKIPTTVLSRCFQLIFGPIHATNLKAHLQAICEQESVTIDDAALDIILEETEGSARDAINLLERVRFSGDRITEETVLSVLGKISAHDIIVLFHHVIAQQPGDIITQLQAINFSQRSAPLMWDVIINICRILLWLKYGVTKLPESLAKSRDQLMELAHQCSINRLHAMLTLLWNQEQLFLQTNKKHLFLEMVLLQLCQQVNIADLDDLLKNIPSTPSSFTPTGRTSISTPARQSAHEPVTIKATPTPSAALPHPPSVQPLSAQASPAPTITSAPWSQFVEKISTLNDPLLSSILMQARLAHPDITNGKIRIALSNKGSFFANKIDETRALWLPHLQAVFGQCDGFIIDESINPALPESKPSPRPAPAPIVITRPASPLPQQSYQNKYTKAGSSAATPPPQEGTLFTIQNPQEWPKASLLLNHFPGKLKLL
jgi:DNA polymerase III subunit gamma/tau